MEWSGGDQVTTGKIGKASLLCAGTVRGWEARSRCLKTRRNSPLGRKINSGMGTFLHTHPQAYTCMHRVCDEENLRAL